MTEQINCGICRYTAGQIGGSLTCQRYPQPHRVARSYWCGEFKSVVEAKVEEPKPSETRTGRARPRLTITDPPTVSKADE